MPKDGSLGGMPQEHLGQLLFPTPPHAPNSSQRRSDHVPGPCVPTWSPLYSARAPRDADSWRRHGMSSLPAVNMGTRYSDVRGCRGMCGAWVFLPDPGALGASTSGPQLKLQSPPLEYLRVPPAGLLFAPHSSVFTSQGNCSSATGGIPHPPSRSTAGLGHSTRV